jgi:hypothetical protein
MLKYLCSIALFVLAIFPMPLSAKMADPVGKVVSFYSDNGVFEVAISYGENFRSWSLKQNGSPLWKDLLTAEPGEAAVSDNGETITLPLWGWRDEGGSSGIAVYNKEGRLLRKIPFNGHDGQVVLRWVRETAISPDGTCVVIGENGKEHMTATLFNAAESRLIWASCEGFPDLDCIRVAANGDFTLAATSNGSDMEFLLFDTRGKVIWRTQKPKNHSYGVKPYVRFNQDGKGFSIYDLKTGNYESFVLPAQHP